MPRGKPARDKAYYEANRERILAQKREYYLRPEVQAHRKARNKAHWASIDRDAERARRSADRAADPEKWRARNRRWAKENPERHRQLQLEHQERKRALVMEKKSLGCSDCGNKDMRVIQLHAPNGHSDTAPRQGGRYPHRPRPIGSGNGWSWKALVAELQICIPLCANCHIIRHAEEKDGAARWL